MRGCRCFFRDGLEKKMKKKMQEHAFQIKLKRFDFFLIVHDSIMALSAYHKSFVL